MTTLGKDIKPLYLGLMEEIKVRFGTISRITQGDIPLPAKAIQEFCLLQIRMVCELISLACLVAHGDISKSNRLTKTYQADRIIAELEKLHPDFFPKPVTMTHTSNPVGWHLQPLKSGFLTKPEFLKLYHRRCGGALHRGSLRNLLSSNRQQQVQFDEIRLWVDKIRKLLDRHIVFLRDGKTVVLAIMDNGNGAVQVAIAAAPHA